MTAETFDAVLADVEEIAQYAAIYYPEADDALHDRIMKAKGRLAAAHAAEVVELRDNLACRTSEMIVFGATALACSPLVKEAWTLLEARADAATALLRECLPYIEGHAQASHLTDGFKRRPNNAHDDIAARVAGMVGRE